MHKIGIRIVEIARAFLSPRLEALKNSELLVAVISCLLGCWLRGSFTRIRFARGQQHGFAKYRVAPRLGTEDVRRRLSSKMRQELLHLRVGETSV